MTCVFPNDQLLQSYYLYSALLVLKLLAFVPLASVLDNPEKVMRAKLNDLKSLTPFWLLAGLYITTSPDTATGLTLLRGFVIARMVIALGYVTRLPKIVTDGASLVTYVVSGFMGAKVIGAYSNAL